MVTQSSLNSDIRKLYPWKGNYLNIDNGLRLHYLDEGRGNPVIMVHGNPTWSFYYRNLVHGLSDNYRCIVPDHIGCGLSDKPQDWPYRLENHVDNLTRLIDALDLHDVTLVVHDWGGAIGFGAALRHIDRIKRLVVFNTAVFDGPLPLSIKMCRWPVMGDVVIRGLNGFLRAGLMRAISEKERLKGAVGKGYLAPYDSWANRRAHVEFVRDIPLEDQHPTRGLFFAIDQGLVDLKHLPMLLIWGEKDFCFTPFYRAEWQQRFPEAETHIFENAAHWVVEDAHEKIIPLMRDFLARHPVGSHES